MLIPSQENIKKIFRIYNNQCSFHDCFQEIIDSDGDIVGNIIFIKSNKKDHPRYDPKLTNEQMISHTNLIMFCDKHCWEVEKDAERFSSGGLKIKLDNDLKNLDSNFQLSDKMYEKFLQYFINYHDPDRFSHIRTYLPLYDDGAGDGGMFYDFLMCDSVYIKPTRHFRGGKFEIIDSRRKISKTDKVIFYPKNGTYCEGVQAVIKIKSSIRVDGIVPDIKKGEYYISIRSSLDDSSKLDEDLKFTVL